MLKRLETPEQFMLDLNWNKDILDQCKKNLEEWDKRPKSFYKNKLSMKVDIAEREHYRNCIEFWEKRLSDENKST